MKQKNKKRGFLRTSGIFRNFQLLGTLGANLLGNIFNGKEILKAGYEKKQGKVILSAGYESKNL